MTVPDPSSASKLLGDRAYVALRDQLITLRIAPGSPINEESFGRAIGVGRTPVREAIRRLALENLVVVHPRRGSFAADIQITDLAHVVEVRQPLEAQAAALAAARLTDVQREELRSLLEQLHGLGSADGGERLMEVDACVHRFIYRCAANPYLQQTLERYFNLSLRIWHLVLHRLVKLEEHVGEHRQLLDMIERGDAEAASRIAAEHVAGFEHRFRAAM